MASRVKTSEFPVTTSVQSGDLIPIIKQVGNNNYKNYVVDAGNVEVPSAKYAETASLVNFYNIVNTPRLVSSSAQFTSSTDSPRFGQITASNIEVTGQINVPILISTSSVSSNLKVLGQAEFDGNITATSSNSGLLIVNQLNVLTSSSLSGSNTIGDNLTETQSLIGSVVVHGNLTLTVSQSIIADSASFKFIKPLVSASIANLTSSVILVDTLLQANHISSSQVTASSINSSTASFGQVDIKANLKVTGSIHGIADQAISSSFAGTSLTANSASNALSASYANTANSSSYSVSSSNVATASTAVSSSHANTASVALSVVSASFAQTSLTASYTSITQVFNNTGSFVKTASNALDQNTASYANSASYLNSGAILTNVTISNSLVEATISYSQTAGTASYVLNSTAATSSYSLTSSLALVANLAITASSALSASTAQQTPYSSVALSAISASNYVLTNQTRQIITHPHTFVSGNLLTLNALGTASLASAANLTSSNVLGIVEYSDYVGSGSGSFYSIVYYGKVSLNNLVAGSTYYLSDSIPGGYSINPPSNSLSSNQPVFTAIDSNNAIFYKVTPTLSATPSSSYAKTASFTTDPATRASFFASNSFSPGQVIAITTAGNPILALANNETDSNVVGIIESANASSFTLIIGGKINGLITSLIPGFIYYLSDTVAGTVVNSRSSLLPTSVIKPIGVAVSSTEMVLYNQFSTNLPIGNSQTSVTASYANNVPTSSFAVVAGAAYTIIGSLPTNGNSIRDTYSQSNSFVAGNVIGFDHNTQSPTLCVADSYRNSDVLGVIESANSSSFTIVYSGKIFLPSGSFPTTGSLYYLSPTISGSYQSTVPTGPGQIVKSLMYSIDNATAVVSINSHAATASAAVSSSYAQNASVANYSITSNSASFASNAVGLTQNGSVFPLTGFVTTGSATTSSVIYLNVNVNGTNYKIPLYGV